MSDHVGNARDYLARRTDELADRRIDLANRAARLSARQPIADYDIFPAVQAVADGLAHAITAHRRTAAQQERTAIAHDRFADLLGEHDAGDRAVRHRQAAAVERAAAARSRVEADRAQREGTPARSLVPVPRFTRAVGRCDRARGAWSAGVTGPGDAHRQRRAPTLPKAC